MESPDLGDIELDFDLLDDEMEQEKTMGMELGQGPGPVKVQEQHKQQQPQQQRQQQPQQHTQGSTCNKGRNMGVNVPVELEGGEGGSIGGKNSNIDHSLNWERSGMGIDGSTSGARVSGSAETENLVGNLRGNSGGIDVDIAPVDLSDLDFHSTGVDDEVEVSGVGERGSGGGSRGEIFEKKESHDISPKVKREGFARRSALGLGTQKDSWSNPSPSPAAVPTTGGVRDDVVVLADDLPPVAPLVDLSGDDDLSLFGEEEPSAPLSPSQAKAEDVTGGHEGSMLSACPVEERKVESSGTEYFKCSENAAAQVVGQDQVSCSTHPQAVPVGAHSRPDSGLQVHANRNECVDAKSVFVPEDLSSEGDDDDAFVSLTKKRKNNATKKHIGRKKKAINKRKKEKKGLQIKVRLRGRMTGVGNGGRGSGGGVESNAGDGDGNANRCATPPFEGLISDGEGGGAGASATVPIKGSEVDDGGGNLSPSDVKTDVFIPFGLSKVRSNGSVFGPPIKEFNRNDGTMDDEDDRRRRLEFYSDTHEDQDPHFVQHARSKVKERLRSELASLTEQDNREKKQLEEHLKKLWQERVDAMQCNVKERHDAMMAKQEAQRDQLLATQKKRLESFRTKVGQSMQYRTKKQNDEKTAALAEHQRRLQIRVQQCKTPTDRYAAEQEANTALTKALQAADAAHQRDMLQFRRKEDEDRKKLEQRFKDQSNMLAQHHLMRQKEVVYDVDLERKKFRQEKHHQLVFHMRRWKDRSKKRREEAMNKLRKCRYYTPSSHSSPSDRPLNMTDEEEFSVEKIMLALVDEEAAEELGVDGTLGKEKGKENHSAEGKGQSKRKHKNVREDGNGLDATQLLPEVGVVSPHPANRSDLLGLSSPCDKAKVVGGQKQQNDKAALEKEKHEDQHLHHQTDLGDSVLRQKLRKTVMSGTPIQLAVDLHNEGIVVHYRNVTNQEGWDGDNKSASEQQCRGGKRSRRSSMAERRSSMSSVGSFRVSGSTEGGADSSSAKDGTDCSDTASSTFGGRTLCSGTNGQLSEFLLWGVKARQIVYSILCGQVPAEYSSDKIDASGQGLLQGGQIKCMVTDMRTSESVASAQRSLAAVGLEMERAKGEIVALQAKAKETHAKLSEREKDNVSALIEEKEWLQKMKKAGKEKENAKRYFNELQLKSARFVNPDGTTLNPNIAEQRELLEGMLRCKNALEMAEKREVAAKQRLTTVRANVTKTQVALTQSQKATHAADLAVKKATKKMHEEAKAATLGGGGGGSCGKKGKGMATPDEEACSKRINDVFSVIRATTDRRRKQLDSKRNGNTDIGYTSDKMSASLKTSFRQKMEHRRLTIVLRPTRESTIKEVLDMVEAAKSKRKDGIGEEGRRKPNDAQTEELDQGLRAEQLLLLALHPEAPTVSCPPVPSQLSDTWAEPGWQLVLDGAPEGRQGRHNRSSSPPLLPRTQFYPTSQSSQSTCYSAPGRQSASVLKPWHLRMLEAPLSKGSMASAPAEPPPRMSLDIKDAPLVRDPFNITDGDMDVGYTFVPKAPCKEKRVVRRGSSSTASVDSEEATPSSSSGTTKKQRRGGAKVHDLDVPNSPTRQTSLSRKDDKKATQRGRKSKIAQAGSKSTANANAVPLSPIPADKANDLLQKVKEVNKDGLGQQSHRTGREKLVEGMNQQQPLIAGMFPQQQHGSSPVQQHQQQQQQAALFQRMMSQQQKTPLQAPQTLQSVQMQVAAQQQQQQQQRQRDTFHHQQQMAFAAAQQQQQQQQQPQQATTAAAAQFPQQQQQRLAQMRMMQQQQQMAYAAVQQQQQQQQQQPQAAAQAAAQFPPQQMVGPQAGQHPPPPFPGQQQGMQTGPLGAGAAAAGAMGSTGRPQQQQKRSSVRGRSSGEGGGEDNEDPFNDPLLMLFDDPSRFG